MFPVACVGMAGMMGLFGTRSFYHIPVMGNDFIDSL